MLNYEEITAELVQARVCKLIRRHIKKKGQTYAEIAEIIDVDQRTLEAWARSETAPKLYHYTRLVMFFGPSFASELFAIIGMTGLHYIDDQSINGHKLLTGGLAAFSNLSKALEDGHIDRREREELMPELKEVSTVIDAFCAAQGGKP